MTRDEHKIILFSIGGGLLMWVAPAALDSFLYSRSPFLDSLFFDVSLRELYSRVLFFAGFVVFGMLAIRIVTKHRRTGERYKDLIELSNDIITITDGEGKCVFMNDAAYRILERSPEEMIGKSFTELLHIEDRRKYLKKLEDMEKMNTDTFIIENRYSTKRGKAINVVQNVRMLKDMKGASHGMLCIARDMTERKQADEALHKAIVRAEDERARWESVLATIDDGIRIQSRDYKVLYQNAAFPAIFGGDNRGEYCYQAFSPVGSPCTECPIEKSMEDGKISTTFEKEISKNGEVHSIELKVSSLRDATGNIVAIIEAARDITARKNMEAKLRMFSVAIEDAMDGILIVGLDGHIVYSNKAIKDIVGYSPEEIVGKHIDEMSADREFALRFIISKIRETERRSGELLAVHKDGRTFPVWLSTAVMKGEHGRPIAIIGTLQDITERKQAEGDLKRHQDQLTKDVEDRTRELVAAQEKLRMESADRDNREHDLLKARKLESLGILAGGIAHDVSNLLASIKGNISLARMELNSENKAHLQLERAEQASLRAQVLTGQLLSFSKGGVPVKKTVAIGDLVRDVTGFILRDSRLKVFFSLPGDLWLVDVDEGQIRQVLHNLVVNADHAMPGGGTITISCENVIVAAPSKLPMRQGDYVRISVRDHGVGLSQEQLSKIFDPSFTTKHSGSGLDLATSYSIIKQHSGHILAESALGIGSTFIIYLPAANSGKASKKIDETKQFTGKR